MSDNLEEHVQINLTIAPGGVAREGFGVAMILSHNADFGGDLIRYYTDIDSVAEDFDTDSPEWRAANALFAQNPKPPTVVIGRTDVEVITKYLVNITDAGETDDAFTYRIGVKGQGFEDTIVSFVATDDSEDEIVAGLVTQLNLVEDKNFTASALVDASGPDTLQILGNAAGNWFSVEILSVTRMIVEAAHTVTGLGDSLTEILHADAGWYCLLLLYPSTDYALDAAEWVESNDRVLVLDVNANEALLTTEDAGADVLKQLFELGYTNTMYCYHHAPDEFFSAAWMGRWLPTTPGQATTKFKTLSGITKNPLTPNQAANLRARRANTYQRVGGRNITWEGTVASLVNKFFDITRNVHWFRDELLRAIFDLFIENDIVEFTPEGVQSVGGIVHAAFDLALRQHVFSPDPEPTVTLPDFNDISSADKSDRELRGVGGRAVFAGAIHKVIADITLSFA